MKSSIFLPRLNKPQDCSRLRAVGFTLVEILLVISLLALIMGVVIVNVGGNQEVAGIQLAKQFVNYNVQAPLMSYSQMNDGYPPTLDAAAKYFPNGKVPKDPFGNPYHYKQKGTHNKNGPDIWSAGPDGVSGNADDIGNW